MPMLSLGQAAKLADVGKTTISRAIASGRLSAGRTAAGGYEIDPAELSRVYELKMDSKTGQPVARDGSAEQQATPAAPGDGDARARVAILEAQIGGLQSTLDAERRRAEAAEADRDRWANQAERIAALLPPPADYQPETKRPGLLGRVFGRKAG